MYEYSGHRLWLAYGLATAISTIIVAAGLIVMFLSSAAYNSSFSTMLRLGRGAHLSQEIVDGDHDGKEPLPKYLEKATISFAGTALWRKDADRDAEYELIPVQTSEHAAIQVRSGGRAGSHGPSTLRSSIEVYEGRDSNEVSLEEPTRGPFGYGSDARMHSPSIGGISTVTSPRSGLD